MKSSDTSPMQRRKRLNSYEASLPGTKAITPIARPKFVVEPPLTGFIVVSLFFHIIILISLIYFPTGRHGSSQGMQQPQVEMVFDAPPVQHSLKGQRSQENGGGSPSPAASASEAAHTPVVPTQKQPLSALSKPSPTGELPDTTQDSSSVTPAVSKKVHRNHPAPAQHKQQRRQENNPFSHPVNLSFNGEKAPHPRRRGRRGGSGGSIDLSTGPLSLNGQINAPYKTQSSVKGVSSDYGAEIDQWVRAHMFYPEEARNAGEDGPASVHVVIDRSGRVRSVRLSGQSGSYSLDAATIGMFQSQKLPPVPPDMAGDHFDLDVTINYILLHR